MMEFSQILKELRESRDLTQKQLAQYLRVSRPTIAGYETKQRQPDFEKLIQLSELFHVSIDYLVTGKNPDVLAQLTLTAPCGTRSLDRKVIHAYHNLGFEEKQDVLEYIRLLELRQRYAGEGAKEGPR